MDELIRAFCARDDLSTYDPYDIWKTKLGFQVKRHYNHHHFLGFVPAASFTIFDTFINNRLRLFYHVQEYPIVRAWAALSLINIYKRTESEWAIEYARRHLEWLKDNTCAGYKNYCWGLGFKHAVSAQLIYSRETPLSTITAYPLEAFVRYVELTGETKYHKIIRSIAEFFDKDIQVMEENERYLVTSYAAMRDRKVINAVSYTMYSLALVLPYISEKAAIAIRNKINKLYIYITDSQGHDGSWLYSNEGRSFIDCFHSCIVLKNLIKTGHIERLNFSQSVVEKGYAYLKKNFFNERYGLFRRFSKKNKPSLTRYDLYDNAEMLNLAYLMHDFSLVGNLAKSIKMVFLDGNDIYSQVDVLGLRRNKNTLRWAVMPYLYALSEIN